MTLTTGAFLRERPQPERAEMSKIKITRATVASDGNGPALPRDVGDVVDVDPETAVFLIAHGKAKYVEDVEKPVNKAVDTRINPARRKG